MEIKYHCAPSYITPYIPTFETVGAAGIDLRADISGEVIIGSGKHVLISTGLSFEIPVGFEGQVRSRSGLAARHGIFMLNAPGTIDADYRGIVSVVAANFSGVDYTVHQNDRIAQFVICPVPHVRYTTADFLSATDRGAGGFGSTGL